MEFTAGVQLSTKPARSASKGFGEVSIVFVDDAMSSEQATQTTARAIRQCLQRGLARCGYR